MKPGVRRPVGSVRSKVGRWQVARETPPPLLAAKTVKYNG